MIQATLSNVLNHVYIFGNPVPDRFQPVSPSQFSRQANEGTGIYICTLPYLTTRYLLFNSLLRLCGGISIFMYFYQAWGCRIVPIYCPIETAVPYRSLRLAANVLYICEGGICRSVSTHHHPSFLPQPRCLLFKAIPAIAILPLAERRKT